MFQVVYPVVWDEALEAIPDLDDELKATYDHAFYFMNTSTGVFIKEAKSTDAIFIPDQQVFCLEPQGDEDPPYKTWYFQQIYQCELTTFTLDNATETQVPPGITVTPGDWATEGNTPRKPEPDFD